MCVCARVYVREGNFARLLEYCLRQFVYPASGHGVRAGRMLLRALEGSAGNILQPSPCSPGSCCIWLVRLWGFFPRDVKAASWPAEGERCPGLEARAESLPLHPALHGGFCIGSWAIPAHRGMQEQVPLHPYGTGNMYTYSCILTVWSLLTTLSPLLCKPYALFPEQCVLLSLDFSRSSLAVYSKMLSADGLGPRRLSAMLKKSPSDFYQSSRHLFLSLNTPQT